MYELVHRDALRRGSGRTASFEGNQHGSGVSFFLVDNDPGQGPRLHVHPYTETWVVHEGEAEFTVGVEKIRATAGDIVVGAANIPHKFLNVGTGRLELVCIHANDHIVQEWGEEKA